MSLHCLCYRLCGQLPPKSTCECWSALFKAWDTKPQLFKSRITPDISILVMEGKHRARRVLGDLPVNPSTMPHVSQYSDIFPSLKRRIQEVEDVEISSFASRPHPAISSIAKDQSAPRIREQKPRSSHCVRTLRESFGMMTNRLVEASESGSPARIFHPQLLDHAEEAEDVASPSSSGNSTSVFDCEQGYETTASQETSQTEVTRPLQSIAHSVCIDVFAPHQCHSWLASARRGASSKIACCVVQSADKPDESTHVSAPNPSRPTTKINSTILRYSLRKGSGYA